MEVICQAPALKLFSHCLSQRQFHPPPIPFIFAAISAVNCSQIGGRVNPKQQPAASRKSTAENIRVGSFPSHKPKLVCLDQPGDICSPNSFHNIGCFKIEVGLREQVKCQKIAAQKIETQDDSLSLCCFGVYLPALLQPQLAILFKSYRQWHLNRYLDFHHYTLDL